jgi:hypothetical protein
VVVATSLVAFSLVWRLQRELGTDNAR